MRFVLKALTTVIVTALALASFASTAWADDFKVTGFSWGCIAPGSLDTSLSHAAGLSDIAVCHA